MTTQVGQKTSTAKKEHMNPIALVEKLSPPMEEVDKDKDKNEESEINDLDVNEEAEEKKKGKKSKPRLKKEKEKKADRRESAKTEDSAKKEDGKRKKGKKKKADGPMHFTASSEPISIATEKSAFKPVGDPKIFAECKKTMRPVKRFLKQLDEARGGPNDKNPLYKLLEPLLHIGDHITKCLSDMSDQDQFKFWRTRYRQKNPDAFIRELQDSLQRLASLCMAILQWIPAHCGIQGNKYAESLAKKGSKKDQPVPELSFREAKTLPNHSDSQHSRDSNSRGTKRPSEKSESSSHNRQAKKPRRDERYRKRSPDGGSTDGRSPENGHSYDKATLKRAMKKVWFNKMSMLEAAKRYKVPLSTLQQKIKALRQKQAERERQKAESSQGEENAESAHRKHRRRRYSSQANEKSGKSEEGEEEEEEGEEEGEEEEGEEEEKEEEEANDQEEESEAEANQNPEEEDEHVREVKSEIVEETKETEEEAEVIEVKEEEDLYQLGDGEKQTSLLPQKEETEVKVKTKAARKAPVKSKPKEAKDKTRTRKCVIKSVAVSQQSTSRTIKQSPSGTPKQSPVQTPKQSPQRSSKQSPSETSSVTKGRQESKMKSSSDIVKPSLSKGKLKTKPPEKPKSKEPVSTEWDSELTQEEEEELIRQAHDFKAQEFPLNMDIFLDFAQTILNENPYKKRSFVDNRPGKEWYQMFVKYHPELDNPLLTAGQTVRQISREEQRKREAAEPAKKQTATSKKSKTKQTKGSRKRKDSQAESSYSEVDDSGNSGTTTEEEEIDVNICSKCEAEYNFRPAEWIGCSSCKRWFHKSCIQIDVTGYTDKEIEELDFICEFC